MLLVPALRHCLYANAIPILAYLHLASYLMVTPWDIYTTTTTMTILLEYCCSTQSLYTHVKPSVLPQSSEESSEL